MHLRNRIYYWIKPLLPISIRMTARRWFARRQREHVGAIWPILPGSGTPPVGWPGWPEGKKFAVVLTHDVEGPEGLAKCRALAEVEKELGFRSAFNLIPDGPYRVCRKLRDELVAEGFEIGVHDLHHDGKLFHNHDDFIKHARKINGYLKDWGAVGFRAGFMLRNLQWLHHLNVEYDASTFDTDPFEPQPDGVGTIFPFWVPNPKSEVPPSKHDGTSALGPRTSDLSSGYVGLPYTLPQDSTLFLLLREANADIWIQKLDWIAEHGGMALLNVHPDYIRFSDTPGGGWDYPISNYRRLLEHIRSDYAGEYWHVLPKRAAAFWRDAVRRRLKCKKQDEKQVTL